MIEHSIKSGRPSESGHWYDRAGKPVYQVERADKKGLKDTTLREARIMKLVPSVTTVVGCAAKPGLEIWKQKQVLLAALTLPKIDGEKESDYLDRIMKDSQEQASKAAEKGKNIHAAIQRWYERAQTKDDLQFESYVVGASEAIYNQYGPVRWRAEESFSHPMGFGGKRDLTGESVGRSGETIVLDVKTKEFNDFPASDNKIELAFDEHIIQGAGYCADFNAVKFANVFVSTTRPGLVYIHEWDEAEMCRGWEMFRALLNYWKAKNKYDGGW